MKHKRLLLIIFCLMFFIVVGYSAYTSNLMFNNGTNITMSDDFRVVFTNVSSSYESSISPDGSTIAFIPTLKTNNSSTYISYRITNYSSQYDAHVDIVLTDDDGNPISSNDYEVSITTDINNPIVARSTSSNGVVTITSKTNNTISPLIYIKMNVSALAKTNSETTDINVLKNWTFDYTGGESTFVVPYTGSYKLEVWGGQGGNCYKEPDTSTVYPGGYGGYSVGTIDLTKDTTLYINIGGHASWKHATGTSQAYIKGGYNGGGDAIVAYNANYYSAGAGGGATHIATRSGQLSTLSSYRDSILIVAGGGGGALSYYDPNYPNTYKTMDYEAHAGGYKSNSAIHSNYGTSYANNIMAKPATQTTGGDGDYDGTFGKGATLSSSHSTSCISGGGGGFYGGGSGNWKGSSGGSSYIGNSNLYDKHMTCYNCEESSDLSTLTVSSTCYSDDPLVNCAKRKAGYAKITFIGE